MSQVDGYVRIVTQNDTTEAERSTEQLGDTIRESLDTTPADKMTDAIDDVRNGIDATGEAAVNAGDLIKANLVSDIIMNGIQQLGSALKDAAVHTVEVADGLDNSVNRIAAATNASADEMIRLKSIVEQIYGDNFGDGFDDIAESVSRIKQNIDDLDDADLVTVTESAYALRDVFGASIEESSRAARAIMQNFKVTAAEAFDYMARSAQNGLDYSGELLDSISEYSVQFKKFGFSLDDMINIMEKGAESGAWKLDTVGDAIKELSIGAIDGSDSTKQGFDLVGLSVDDMAQKFGKGGEAARAAFTETVSALASMTDPIKQDAAGVALFGTMWEDLGKSVVLSMTDISDSAYDAAGAMDDIKDINYNSLSNSLNNVKRQIDLLIQPIGESLIPVLDEAADKIAEIAGNEELNKTATAVGKFISGTLSILMKNINAMASAITGITTAVIAFKTASMLSKITASWQTAALQMTLLGNAQGAAGIKAAALRHELTAQEVVYSLLSGKLDIATAKTATLNTVMSMNPAGAIAAVVGVLATALTSYAITSSSAADSTDELNDTLNTLKDTTKDSIADGEAELIMLKKKADKYSELRSAVSLTSDEHEELARLAGDLQNVLGDETQVVNSLTGEYNDLSTAVDKYIEKRHKELLLSAYEDETKAALAQIQKNKQEADALSEELFDLTNWDETDSPEADGPSPKDSKRIEEIQNRLKEIKDANLEYQKVVDEYDSLSSSFFSSGSSLSDSASSNKVSSSGSSPANYLPDYWKKKSEDFKYWKDSYKFDFDMGRISAEEYYSTLAMLRDKYLENDSDEWRSVSVEIKKYYDQLSEDQQKAYDERLAAQKKADEEAANARKTAYNSEKSQLEFKLKTNQITEKKYYSELSKLRDKYLDKNSDEWRAAFLETYEYNQKIINANKDSLQQLLNDTSDSTLSALEKIVSARDSLTAKLTDFNKTFEKVSETIPETVAVKGDFTITTAEHDIETYKMGADSIEDNIKVIEDYGAMLDALKARGADESVLSSILDMDIEEGMKYGSKLLKMSENAWDSYFDSLERLHKTAADISAKYYQSEVDSLKENFIGKLEKAMSDLGTDMYKVGADVAAEFIKGWNESLGTKDLTLNDLMRSVSAGTLSTAPTAARNMAASTPSAANEQAKLMLKSLKVPVYIGTSKLEEIVVDCINGQIIRAGKNILLT